MKKKNGKIQETKTNCFESNLLRLKKKKNNGNLKLQNSYKKKC